LFRIGDILKGTAWTKAYEEREFADYYRAGSIEIISRENENITILPPPWVIPTPSLQIYEERGARQLSKTQWKTKCFQCVWANMANVEIQWDFDRGIKNIDLKHFAMVQNHANITKWENHVLFHIKIWEQYLMTVVWMKYVLKVEMKTSNKGDKQV
jgi:hypothetical protein